MSDEKKGLQYDNVTEPLNELRAWGWSVAVHNDYRQDGEPHTFWLFTHPDGRCVKGEGRTDAEALALARGAVIADAAAPGRSLTAPQSMPTGNGVPILELVLADLRAKSAAGTKKYGTPLKTENGPDALVDAYQEALDLPMYLRQEIQERQTATRKERARCVAIARAEEARWREEAAKPIEQRNMYASSQALLAAEATAGRIAAAMEAGGELMDFPLKARATSSGLQMCLLCGRAIVPGDVVALTGDAPEPVHATCPTPQSSGAV